MEEKTLRLLIAGAIVIILAGGIFGGWFKAAADLAFGKAPVASTAPSTTQLQTTTQPQQSTTTTHEETTTQPHETTTTMPEKPKEPEPVDIVYKLDGQNYIEYQGYKFKLEKIYVREGNDTSIDIIAVKPDGGIYSYMAGKDYNTMIDQIMIRFTGEYSQAENWATIRFIVYKATLKLDEKGFQEYKGYKFKIDHLIYAVGYTVAGAVIDVVKPDGSEVLVQVGNMADGLVDSLQIHFDGEYQKDVDGKYQEGGWMTVKIRGTDLRPTSPQSEGNISI